MNTPRDQQPRQPQAPRNPPDVLRHAGRRFGWNRRTRFVNDKLERHLGSLDSFAWHVERDVTIASVAIPFVVFGPSGLFLLQASRGFWINEDVALMSGAARALRDVLRYPDPVRRAIVLQGESNEERQHFTGEGNGPCCVVGVSRLVEWLHRYDDHGFSEADLGVIRDAADPRLIRERARNVLPAGRGHSPESHEDFYFPG